MVFRFSAMGDVAMAAPVLRALLIQHKELEIIMVSRPFFAPIFKDIPRLQFIGVDLNNHYKGLAGLYKLSRLLQKEKPDFVADLHDVLRTKILRSFFKIAGYKVAVIDKGRQEKKALTRSRYKMLKPLRTTHERYANVFEHIGFPVDLQRFVSVKPELSASVRLFLNPFEGQKLIGVAPFAAHEGKQYPIEKIKVVLKRVLEQHPQANFLLFGGPDDKVALETLEALDRNRIVNTAGLFQFEEELQLISRLNLMVSMDSGNGHLAALFGVPVITIWGATHPYAGFAPLFQTEDLQLLPDLNRFPQLPTSIYGQKTFDSFEEIWESISPEKIADKIIKNL